MDARPRRSRRRRWVGVSVGMLMLWLGAALVGCDGPPLGGFTQLLPTPTPTATSGVQPTISPAPTILPAFSGWRAVYLHSDGHLHAISLDDQSDLAGMVAPGLAGDPTSTITSAGAAPDGRAIAYAVDDTLTVLDLARHRIVTYREPTPVRLIWSPDSAHLAVEETDMVRLLDRASAKLTDATPTGLTHPAVLGWRADGALILQTADPDYTVVTLWAEDIQTKAAHQITQIPVSPQNPAFKITIAPNGAACVLYTWRFQSNPFTPLVETVDLATGALHPLPNITKTTGANLSNLTATWRADGAQLAMARPGAPDNSQINSVWIMDFASDTAILGDEGNNPVGWAPDGSAIILSGLDIATFGYPPHGLAVLRLPLHVPRLTELTDSAVVFPVLGFVRGG